MIQNRLIEYDHNGTILEGYLVWDDALTGPRPGILISHAWGGRDQFVCDKATALAELGYVGFAQDMYGKGVFGNGPEENTKLMTPLIEDRALLQSRISLGLDTLKAQDEVDASNCAAMGFCFGGLCVLDLARIGTDINGVVSFHGLFGSPGNTDGTRIKAKVLALHGNDDPMVPVDVVTGFENELTAANADWQIHVYGNTSHAFTNPVANDADHGLLYNENADKRSWITMKNFFEEIL